MEVKKIDRYESTQMFRGSRDTKSAGDSFIVRNLSASQDLPRDKEKGKK